MISWSTIGVCVTLIIAYCLIRECYKKWRHKVDRKHSSTTDNQSQTYNSQKRDKELENQVSSDMEDLEGQ